VEQVNLVVDLNEDSSRNLEGDYKLSLLLVLAFSDVLKLYIFLSALKNQSLWPLPPILVSAPAIDN
jgi:hypothetical protein